MRVALVSEHASPLVAINGINAAGQHVHVAELASGLVRLGHSVAVYARRNDPNLTQWVTTSAGYEVIQVPAGPEAPMSEDICGRTRRHSLSVCPRCSASRGRMSCTRTPGCPPWYRRRRRAGSIFRCW